MNTEEGEVVPTTAEFLERVLMNAAIVDGLRRGLHESVKALDRGVARLCVLSNDCDNEEYKRLIKALCMENNVSLIIMSGFGNDLSQWVGLAKLNADGTVRKAARCSVAVVTDFGEDCPQVRKLILNPKSIESDVVSFEPGKGLEYQWATARNPQQPFKHHDSDPTYGKAQYKSASKNLFDGGGSELYHVQKARERDEGRRATKRVTKHKIGNGWRSDEFW